MSVEVKRRRGSSSEMAIFTPALGEIAVNIDDYSIVVGDGSKVGGRTRLAPGADLTLNLTLVEAVSAAYLELGGTIQISDRSNGRFSIVLASGVTPNAMDIIQCVGSPTLALQVEIDGVLDVGWCGVTNTDSTAILQRCADIAVAQNIKLIGYGETTVSSQVDFNTANVDFSRLKIKVADNTSEDDILLFDGSGAGENREISLLIDGNKANQDTVTLPFSRCAVFHSISNPFLRVKVLGVNCPTVAAFVGSTEKFYADIAGTDCLAVVEVQDGAAGPVDITPDEANIDISGSNCGRYFRNTSSGSGTINFNCEGMLNDDSAAVVITNGKTWSLNGELRQMSTPFFINANTTHLQFNLALNNEGITAGIDFVSVRTLSGNLTVKGAASNKLWIKEMDEGGVLSFVSIGTGLDYSVRLGDNTAGTLVKRLLLQTYTVGKLVLERAEDCQIQCAIAPTELDILNVSTQGNHITVPRNFIINDSTITQTATQDNTITVIGNLNETEIRAFSTPVRGLRAEHNRSAQSRPSYYVNLGNTDGWQRPKLEDISISTPLRTSGTATVLNGTSSIVVTHGIASSPNINSLNLVVNSSAAAQVQWYIDTFNTTTFTVNTVGNVGADTSILWQLESSDLA